MNRPRSNSRGPSRKWARAAAEQLLIGGLITRLPPSQRPPGGAAPPHRRADPAPPLGVPHAHGGPLGVLRIGPDPPPHFGRRPLVPAGLDDVHARATQDPVRAVFDDGDIAGAEPAVSERRGRRLRLPPVLEKHRCAAHLDLPLPLPLPLPRRSPAHPPAR